MKPTAPPLLQAINIGKRFPGVLALDRVSLSLNAGRLTALLGENGAGKSTLMNIIAGVLPQDSGRILLRGKQQDFKNTREAQAAGIAMIYQELNLVNNLSVAENIFLGREPLTAFGLIDKNTLHHDTEKLLNQLQLAVAPDTPLNRLRVGQQQIVEIAKALACRAQVLIMDEPTSAITQQEVEVLFGLIDQLKMQGVAIAYITHKLDELTRIGDDAVVMRDGKLMGSAPLKDLSRDEIIAMMVGRNRQVFAESGNKKFAQTLFAVEDLQLQHPQRKQQKVLQAINLRLHRGEVLGIFGLMGAGRSELLECLFGLHGKYCRASFIMNGESIDIQSPHHAIQHGLALAPEDRKTAGLILSMSVAENLSLASLPNCDTLGFIHRKTEAKLVTQSIQRFKVKTPSAAQLIRNLSGGNQQKVILGKWLATQPRVLLLDEPTRGIDINAKAEIYALIRQLCESESGLGIILVSSELPEILAVCDRIMVMCEGRKSGEFARCDANEKNILQAALPGARVQQ